MPSIVFDTISAHKFNEITWGFSQKNDYDRVIVRVKITVCFLFSLSLSAYAHVRTFAILVLSVRLPC